jgi:hypothetical protein
MAVEAMYQTAMMTKWKKEAPAQYRFRLRDVKLLRALVLTEEAETRVSLVLTPVKGGSTRSWYDYQMCSEQEGIDVDFVHSTGTICIETDYQNTVKTMEPLELPTSARIWYKTLAEMGYNFGPSFQKHLMVESTMGQYQSRSTVNLEPPPSHPKGQSPYPMHPAVIDGCFQAATPSLWKGHLPQSGDPVLVPKTIDSIVIESGAVRQAQVPTEGVAYASASFLGVGNVNNARNYATNVDLYDPLNGALLFQMKGLASAEMETSDSEKAPHRFMHVKWNADIDMLLDNETSLTMPWLGAKSVQEVIDLVAHKIPGLNVMEMNLSALDGSSTWMVQDSGIENPVRSGCSQYHLAVRDPKVLLQAQELLGSRVLRPQFHLVMDINKPANFAEADSIDLAIINAGDQAMTHADGIVQTLAMAVKEGGFIVATGLPGIATLGKTIVLDDGMSICRMAKQGDKAPHDLQISSTTVNHLSLLEKASQQECSEKMAEVSSGLTPKSWLLKSCTDPIQEISSNASIVIVLDELFSPVMTSLNERQWGVLQHLSKVQCPVLWVTSRSTDPTRAAIGGFLATIRAEEQVPLFTLDVEHTTGSTTTDAISACLERMKRTVLEASFDPRVATDYDFVERGGVIYISRVYNDIETTIRQNDKPSDRKTETVNLHDSKNLVQLRCERLGNVDSVHFGEVAPEPVVLPEGMVEVEIYAAGLNYKDVVVTSKHN